MRILEIDATGEFKEREVSRKDISIEFDAHLRDLRPIFSLRQMPTLSRRGKGIVLNFRSVKVLIGDKHVLVFGMESSKIEDIFVPGLIENIKKDGSRFELQVLESALMYIIQKSKTTYERISRIAENTLNTLRHQARDEHFEKLLALKKQLLKLQKNVKELNEMMDDILDDPEEMDDLVLGRTTSKAEDEVESILENALEQIEDVANRIDELDANIDDTQEILTLKLSSRRNEIIRIDLLLSVITAIFALLAVVTGLFGMNIKNNLEPSFNAFIWVLGGMVLFGVLAMLGLWLYLRKKKVV